MKKVLSFIIITIICNSLAAQKIKLVYGGNFGVSITQFVPYYEIKYEYFGVYDRDIQISEKNRFVLGYNAGVFLRIRPLNSKFYLETDVFISHFGGENKYTISYDHYSSSNPDANRIYIEGYDSPTIFNTINIPVLIGFQKQYKEKLNYGLFGGISTYIVLPEYTEDIFYLGPDEYRKMFLSYMAGFQVCYQKLFARFKFERSLDIQNPEWDLMADELNRTKVVINMFGISMGIKLNLLGA